MILRKCVPVLILGCLLQLDVDAGEINEILPEHLYAQAAVLMDGDTGRILYGKNADEVLAMASTTKIMTCIVALEHVSPDEEAVVSAYAASMPEVSLGLREGQVVTVENLLYAMMLESHNDAAAVIAEHVAGTVENFASMMNAKAKEIGCTHTFYVTPNGLDGEAVDENGILKSHSTTAKDLALVLRYCMKISGQKAQFTAITTAPSWQFQDVPGTYTQTLTNHNSYLNMRPGASSGKTGFTNKAGYCYVGSVTDGGRTFIAALLACGWPDNKNYKWHDMNLLMDYGMDHYTLREIDVSPVLEPVAVRLATGEIDRLHDLKYLQVQTDTSVYPEPLTVLLREDESVDMTADIIRETEAPVTIGQMAGTLTFCLNDLKLRSYPVIFAEDASLVSLEWCVRKISDIFFIP